MEGTKDMLGATVLMEVEIVEAMALMEVDMVVMVAVIMASGMQHLVMVMEDMEGVMEEYMEEDMVEYMEEGTGANHTHKMYRRTANDNSSIQLVMYQFDQISVK